MTTDDKVIIKTLYYQVCNINIIWTTIIPQNKGKGNRAIQEKYFCMSLQLSWYESESHSDKLRYVW